MQKNAYRQSNVDLYGFCTTSCFVCAYFYGNVWIVRRG